MTPSSSNSLVRAPPPPPAAPEHYSPRSQTLPPPSASAVRRSPSPIRWQDDAVENVPPSASSSQSTIQGAYRDPVPESAPSRRTSDASTNGSEHTPAPRPTISPINRPDIKLPVSHPPSSHTKKNSFQHYHPLDSSNDFRFTPTGSCGPNFADISPDIQRDQKLHSHCQSKPQILFSWPVSDRLKTYPVPDCLFSTVFPYPIAFQFPSAFNAHLSSGDSRCHRCLGHRSHTLQPIFNTFICIHIYDPSYLINIYRTN
ncbi:hypothetical protein DL93DRAFT_1948539 [Clavulina sp. PMI_390]|nr:hypothetical protein DL93DRAFT_1948539 [Clavulina sp. PMI_390]